MSVADRWHKTEAGRQVRTAEYGCEARWQVRWRDDQDRQKKLSFVLKKDAEAYDAKVKTQLADGQYVDPSAGDVSFRDYAEEWRKAQPHELNTAERVESALRCHCYAAEGTPGKTSGGGPAIGDQPMRVLAKRVTLLQAWIRGLALNPNSARTVVAYVSGVFTAAVDDRIISQNPLSAKSIRKPAAVRTEAVPWTAEQVEAVAAQMPARLAALAYLGAACGLRQGELFAVELGDVDFLRKTVRIEAQVKIVGGIQVFAPLKNKKPRTVPVAAQVIPVLAEHVRRYPPAAVTLPWHEPDGKHVSRRLLFTRPDSTQLNPEAFNRPWRAAWTAAGIPDRGRLNGCHVLRHTAASAWLSAGLNPAKVAAFLGDTLEVVMQTYAHFLPDDDDRARVIMDSFFAAPQAPAGLSAVPHVP